MVYLDQILRTYLLQPCPATGMQNSDETAGRTESVNRKPQIYIKLKNTNRHTILKT